MTKKRPAKKTSSRPSTNRGASKAAPKKKTAERKPAAAARGGARPGAKASPAKAAAPEKRAAVGTRKVKGAPTSRVDSTARLKGSSVASRAKGASRPAPLAEPRAAKPVKPPVRRHTRAHLERIRQMLNQKRRALTRHIQVELSELERPEKKHRADLEEIASDTHETDSLCEIMGIESTQIDQIERALRQIDDGTYGICEDCGGEIPLVRLEALPFATQCIECKRRAEFAGKVSAAMLDNHGR